MKFNKLFLSLTSLFNHHNPILIKLISCKRIMLTLSCLIVIMLAFTHEVNAQAYTTSTGAGNPESLNTETDNIVSDWTAITTAPQSSNIWSDAQDIPFSFEFFGSSVTQFKVSQNGLLTFDASASGTPENNNTSLPNANLSNNTIAWFWDNFTNSPPTGSNDVVWTKTFGDSPNRQFWIKTYSFEYASYTYCYFAVALEETTNKIYIIDYSYHNAGGSGSSTIGVQQNSTTAVQYSDNYTFQTGGLQIADNDYYAFTPVVSYPAPSDQTVNNVTTLGADLGWTENGTTTFWDLYIVETGGVAPTGSTIPTVNDTQNNPYTWTGGNINTAYNWYVRADCGQNNIDVSNWTGASTFETSSAQEYTLGIGYQFISTRIIPEDPDMQFICNDILDNLDFVRNTGGYMLRKIGPNWINSIGDWVTTEGYLFKMADEDVFSISGDVIDPQTPIPLVEGYQFVSFLLENQIDALVAFTDVLDNLDFVRNTGGFMLSKIGPNWVNSIGDLNPGEGYLVKMNAVDILIYPVDGEKFTGIANIKPEYFDFDGGNAADPVYTMYVSGLNIGDEVAAYDGDLMVGAMTVISENVFDNSLAIFNTLTYGQGYSEGNAITLKVWNKTTNDIVSVNFSMESIYNSYVSDVYPNNDGEFSVVKVSKGTSVTSNELVIYPNPATNLINIISQIEIVNIKVYNYVGQSVYEAGVNNLKVQINTDDFKSGVYIVRIETCKGVETHKVTFN